MTEAEFLRKAQMLALTEGFSGEERQWIKGLLSHPAMQKMLGKLLLKRADIASALAQNPLWGDENLARAIRLQGEAQGYLLAVTEIFAIGEENQDERTGDDDDDSDDSGDSGPSN